MKNSKLTTIPFSGFYCSYHEQNLDDALERIVQNSSGNDTFGDLLDRIHSQVNWGMAMQIYAKTYALNFACQFNLELEFDELSSPREYNFTTDRVFCRISQASIKKIWKAINKEKLQELIRARFTSCDGFISYYPNSLNAWPSLKDWDHNQLGTLVHAYVYQQNEEFDREEYELIDDCNGAISDIIDSALTEEGQRIATIAHYLRERENRRYRTPKVISISKSV